MIILGLDMSSTVIGHAVIGAPVPNWGHAELPGDIAARCACARATVARLLDVWGPTLVVIESPVARFAKSLLPQARVSGAVLSLLAERAALWQEVPPTVAKRVLCGDGAATKAEMVAAAAQRLGLQGRTIRTVRGKVTLVEFDAPTLTEDEADAYALALCGAAMKVQVAA